jgi:multimeric flavodoxin WrbA
MATILKARFVFPPLINLNSCQNSATLRWRTLSTSSTSKPPPNLLIVYHSRTGLAKQMSEALQAGAKDAANQMESPLAIKRIEAKNATLNDVLKADGYLFCCPENLASTSGQMLEFFHSKYYHCFSNDGEDGDEVSTILGKPYGLAIAAGSDGSNAARQIVSATITWFS